MIKKDVLPPISPNRAFEYDRLGRKPIADNLTRLISTINAPVVLSINAPWGTGKTTFIRMWNQHLVDLGYKCLYFDAWKADFVREPLVAFIAEFEELATTLPSGSRKKIKLAKFKKYGKKLVELSIPIAVKVATAGIIGATEQKAIWDSIKDIFSASDTRSAPEDKTVAKPVKSDKVEDLISNTAADFAKSEIQNYKDQKKTLTAFQDGLKDFIKSLDSDKPIVFFIDELDRCRPSFAIELLETIKHLFSAEGLVFVLSLDMEQLAQSAKVLYGQEMDTGGYFRRLIDLEFTLPKPSGKKLIQHLTDLFEITRIDPRNTLPEEFLNRFEKGIEILVQVFDLSPRDQYRFFNIFRLSFTIISKDMRPYYPYLMFLICLKIKKQDFYERFISQQERGRVTERITEILPGYKEFSTKSTDHQDNDIAFFFHVIMIGRSTAPLTSQEIHKTGTDMEQAYYNRSNRYDSSSRDWKKEVEIQLFKMNPHPQFVQAIEFTGNFSESF